MRWPLVLVVALGFLSLAVAQEENNESKDAADKELVRIRDQTKLEAEIAKLKAETAQHRKAEAEAKGSDKKGLEGIVDLGEGAGYFAAVLAYESIDMAAEEIAKDMEGKLDSMTMLTTMPNLNEAWATWEAVNIKIKASKQAVENFTMLVGKWNNELCNKPDSSFLETLLFDGANNVQELLDSNVFSLISSTSNAAGIELIGAKSTLGALADVFSFFRTNKTLRAYALESNDRVLLAKVAEKLLATKKQIVAPELYVGRGDWAQKQMAPLLDQYAQVGQLQRKILFCNATVAAKIKKLRNDLAAIKKNEESADKTEVAARVEQLEAALGLEQLRSDVLSFVKGTVEEGTTEIQKAIDDLSIYMITPSESSPITPLEIIAIIDRIQGKQPSVSHILFLNIIDQGGEVHLTKSVWTGGGVSYIGGSTVVYFLATPDGELKAAGTKTKYAAGTYGNRRGVKGLKLIDLK